MFPQLYIPVFLFVIISALKFLISSIILPSDDPFFITSSYFLRCSIFSGERSIIVFFCCIASLFSGFVFLYQFGLGFCLFIFQGRHLNVDWKLSTHKQSWSTCQGNQEVTVTFSLSRILPSSWGLYLYSQMLVFLDLNGVRMLGGLCIHQIDLFLILFLLQNVTPSLGCAQCP